MTVRHIARTIATAISRRANRALVGTATSAKRLRAVLAGLVARVNGDRLTAAAYLASIGADDDTIRRYSAQVGIRASKTMRALGAEPARDGLALVARRRLVACNTYPAAILADTVRDYPKTSHLIGA